MRVSILHGKNGILHPQKQPKDAFEALSPQNSPTFSVESRENQVAHSKKHITFRRRRTELKRHWRL